MNALLDEWAATPLGNDELVVDVPVLEWAVEMTPHLRAALEALLRDLDAKIAVRNEQNWQAITARRRRPGAPTRTRPCWYRRSTRRGSPPSSRHWSAARSRTSERRSPTGRGC